MTGFFDGDVRFGAIYRNQWFTVGSPYGTTKYETYGGFVDGQIRLGKRKTDYIAVGGVFIRDVAGDQALTVSDGKLSVAYSKSFGNKVKHSLALGLQAEIMFKQFRNGNAQFPDGVIENIGKSSMGIDATVGLRYHVEFQRWVNMYLGFAYAHVSRPTETFLNVNTEKLYSKIVASGGAVIAIQDKFNLVPNVMFLMQGPAIQANVGASAQYVFGNRWESKNTFSFGVNARFGRPEGADAIIPNIRLDYHNFIVGVAYDVNVSNLRRASHTVGAIEVGLMYIYKHKKRGPNTITICPVW
jgi:type IX secretion system PorP/SprF family membrane protein